MAESKGTSQGNWNYSYHAVAFLDLMGQRKVFDDMPGVPKTEEDGKRLIQKLSQTVGFISQFRKGFKDMFEAIQSNRPVPENVPPELREEFRRLRKSDIHLQSVSDAVIAWASIHTVDEAALAQAMNGLWGIMATTASMNLLALASEHPLRGGIDVDGGIPIVEGGNEIYGRALNCAYELESQIAKSPRIAIGAGLLGFLESVSSDAPRSRPSAHAKHVAERCQGLIAHDDDGVAILHFLGEGVLELAKRGCRRC